MFLTVIVLIAECTINAVDRPMIFSFSMVDEIVDGRHAEPVTSSSI